MSMDPTEVGNAVKAYLSANPDTNGVLTLGPVASEPTMAALEEIEMLDKVKFGTFDLSPGVLQAIDEGKMLSRSTSSSSCRATCRSNCCGCTSSTG